MRPEAWSSRTGRTRALTGVSLDVAEGEIVAITGPSGSGKSTLLHCLAGIIRPESGEVVLDGRRIDTLAEAELTRLRRESFGVVFQFGELVPELTAAENVALPMLFNRRGRQESMNVAADWLDRLGATDWADQRPGELSGGQLTGWLSRVRWRPARAWSSPTSPPERWTHSGASR